LSKTITVEIGTEGMKLSVYEAVIRKSPTFFDNALKPEWATSRSDPRLIDLTDEDPDTFKIYLHWLHFKTLPTVHAEEPSTNESTEHVALSMCYVLGEKLMDKKFKNAIVKALHDTLRNHTSSHPRVPDYESINIIYTGTTENSPARRLLVGMWTTIGLYLPKDFAEFVNDALHPVFTQDLAKALSRMQSGTKGDLEHL
jgi:hypothetical protein